MPPHPAANGEKPTATQTPSPSLALKQAAKGSHPSMWELLQQLGVLLPYVAGLVPLLDRKRRQTPPDLSELGKEISGIQTKARDWEIQSTNQALRMEGIEQQIAAWRAVQQANLEQSQELTAELASLRRWVIAVAIAVLVLFLAGAGMMVASLARQ